MKLIIDAQKREVQNVLSEKKNIQSEANDKLCGTIRRINYLLDERDKLEKEAKEKNQYISKLETKIGKNCNKHQMLELLWEEL